MDRYCVFGHPIAHSRSPWIHARFAQLTSQPIEYTAQLAPLDGFAASVRAFFAQGGRGCNVTVPFKHEAAALVDEASQRVQLCGAANTLIVQADGRIRADNTDGLGLVADIVGNAQQSLTGRRILLLGAGGAAAGVLAALIEQAPAELVVVNRTPERAAALVERHAAFAAQHRQKLTYEVSGVWECLGTFDVVINATASALNASHSAAKPANALIPASVLGADCLVYDLMYGPATAPFLHWVAAHGARTRDGLGMLVEQAAAAFALWRGVRPPTAGVLAELRTIVDAAAPKL